MKKNGGDQMDTLKILVVDDEKEIADLVEIYLVSDGYKGFLDKEEFPGTGSR
jgi:two-component system response regulator VanR